MVVMGWSSTFNHRIVLLGKGGVKNRAEYDCVPSSKADCGVNPIHGETDPNQTSCRFYLGWEVLLGPAGSKWDERFETAA